MNNSTVDFYYPNRSFSNLTFDQPAAAERLTWLILVLFASAFGLVGNIGLLLALFVHRPLRQSSSRYLIVHCIVIDLYLSFVAVPTSMVAVYLGNAFQPGSNYCRFQSLYIYAVCTAGMYAECVLAVHRLVGAVLPHSYNGFRSKWVTIACLVLPWIFGVGSEIFPLIGVGVTMRRMVSGVCFVVPLTRSGSWYYGTIAMHVPFLLTGVSYVVILVKSTVELRRKKNNAPGLRRRVEIARTLFFSFLWHMVTSYMSSFALGVFDKKKGQYLWFQLLVGTILSAYVCFNPLFFWASSRLFRDGVKEVIRGRWWSSTFVSPIGSSLTNQMDKSRRISRPQIHEPGQELPG